MFWASHQPSHSCVLRPWYSTFTAPATAITPAGHACAERGACEAPFTMKKGGGGETFHTSTTHTHLFCLQVSRRHGAHQRDGGNQRQRVANVWPPALRGRDGASSYGQPFIVLFTTTEPLPSTPTPLPRASH